MAVRINTNKRPSSEMQMISDRFELMAQTMPKGSVHTVEKSADSITFVIKCTVSKPEFDKWYISGMHQSFGNGKDCGNARCTYTVLPNNIRTYSTECEIIYGIDMRYKKEFEDFILNQLTKLGIEKFDNMSFTYWAI